MSDVIYSPLVDSRYETYRSCFTRAQAEALLDAVRGMPKLERLVDNLAINWRAASDAGATGREILDNACAAPGLYYSGDIPDEHLQDISEACFRALADVVPEITRNKDLASRIKTAALRSARRVRTLRQNAPVRFPEDAIWSILMQDMRFGLRLHDSQRLCYSNLYNSYETFLVDLMRMVGNRTRLRATEPEFKDIFRRHFGEQLIQQCWFDQRIDIARVTRHALSHAGGRITPDLLKLNTSFIVQDGLLQIWPNDNWNLVQLLHERVMRLLVKASNLSQFGIRYSQSLQPDDKANLTSTLEVVDNAVTLVHATWKLYVGLFEDLSSRQLLAECMGPMWDSLMYSLAESVVLGIAKLADPAETGGTANASIRQLLRDADPCLDEAIVVELESMVEEFLKAARVLIQHRMKRIAHHDLAVATAKAPALKDFGIGEVEIALEIVRRIMNLINHEVYNTRVLYESPIIGEPARGLLLSIKMAKAVNDLHFSILKGDVDCEGIKRRIAEIVP
jgi:hypothetical protein